MAEVHGSCDERFGAVRKAFEDNFDAGLEIGASVAVAVNGELVVDLWGGYADRARTQAWERDTIVNTWSSTKTMTSLCALVLADRGELDFEAPVSRYWPEFAAGGKSAVLVRHILGHTSGLSGWQEPMTMRDLADWQKATELLAVQEPWWEPGTASAYHGLTQGFLVGEVVKRITGQSLGTFFAEQLTGPLNADFHIGLAEEHHVRVAEAVDEMPDFAGEADPSSVAFKTMSNPPITPSDVNTAWWREAEIPAANGHGNARSIAVVQSVLAHETSLGGGPMLSRRGREAVLALQSDGVDLLLGGPIRFTLGYAKKSEALPIDVNERTVFWGGRGGSLVIVDLDGVVLGYAMNRIRPAIVGDERGVALIAALQSALAAIG